MNLLTTTGYKSIEDCNIGEQLIAYDIFDGSVILNELLEKQWMSPDMFEDEYSIPEQVVDEDGNPVFEQVPVLDENGNPVYVQVPVFDEDGNPVYEQVPVLDEEGNPTYVQVPVVDEDGYLVFDEEGNQVFENGEQIFQQGGQVFENGEQILEDGDPVMTEPVLLRTKKQIFEETYGELSAYRINDTWDLYWGQSIWADLNVVHAQDLQVGDIVYDDNDNDIEITSIEKVDVDGWWRLSVSGDHSFIDDGITLHNASRYWVGGGANSNWNATGNTNWGSTSGGTNNASVPTSVDDVIFDGAGVNGNTNSTISADTTILSLDITTGYTATMTHNAVLNIAGNWTFTSGYTIAGSSSITIVAASTITSNGRTWPNALTIGASLNTVHTIVGNLTVGGLFVISQAAQTFTTSTSGVLTLQNGIQVNYQFGTFSVTSVDIYLTGGTWSGGNVIAFTNLYLQGNVTLSGVVTTYGGSITYISGVITTTGSTLNLQWNATLNTNGVTWNNIGSVSQAKTITLTSNLSMSGLFSINMNTIVNTSNSSTWTVGGGITLDVNRTLSGTAKIILTGGTWQTTTTNSGIFSNMDIAGNVTIGAIAAYSTGVLTYVSGTVTVAGSTLYITGSCTLNTSGMTWSTIYFVAASTVTLTSNLSASFGYTNANTTVNKTTSETFTLSNGLSVIGGFLLGTADIYLTGGTWTGSTQVRNNLFIQGNVTLGSSVFYQTGTLTYLSGTVTSTGSTLTLTSSCTLNTAGITWNDITLVNNGGVLTLASNLTCGGVLTNNGINSISTSNSSTATLSGGLAVNNTLGGTAKLILTGGTWSGSAALSNNFDINGNVTVSGNVSYSTGTLAYVSGAVTTTGSTLNITGSCTLNTNGIAWNGFVTNVTVKTITLTSNLLINGLFFTSTTGTTTFNRTTTETVTCAGGMNSNNPNSVIQGTADFYLTGGTWGQNYFVVYVNLFINGDCVIANPVFGIATLTYLSGNVLCTGIASLFNCTLDTQGISWNILEVSNPGTILLKSNLNINGVFRLWYTHNFTRVSNQVINCNGGLTGNPGGVSYAFNIGADLYINGGIFDNNGAFFNGGIYLNGNVTILNTIAIGGGGAFTPTSLIYLSGRPNVSSATLFVGVGINTLINMDKVPFRTVTITQNITVTMNKFFAGTPSRPCSISTTGTPSSIAFQDGFEKIGKFVNLSNVFITRPSQLLLITNPRFNINRATNSGIRYVNQSPNGLPKNSPSITDTMQSSSLGLLSDPNFVR